MSAANFTALTGCHNPPIKDGVAVALARAAMAGMLGAEVDLAEAIDLEFLAADVPLFSASNGQFILSVAAEDEAAMEELFAGQAVRIGTVTEQQRLVIWRGAEELVDVSIKELKGRYKGGYRGV